MKRGIPIDAPPVRRSSQIVRDSTGRVTHRECPEGGEMLSAAAFHKAAWQSSGIASYCKKCVSKRGAADYLKRTHGLTRADVDRMRVEQDNKCAICGTHNPLHLDHDHVTGAVRQLLCGNCNMALGLFKDDPALLTKAAAYLRRHRPPKTVACETRRPAVTARVRSHKDYDFVLVIPEHRHVQRGRTKSGASFEVWSDQGTNFDLQGDA